MSSGAGRWRPPTEPKSDRAARIGGFLGSPGGRWLQTAAVAALCFGVGYFLAVGFLFPASERPEDRRLVTVPDLVGLGTEAAEESLRREGLEPEVRARIHHPRAGEGAVVAQSPLPGQLARPGAPVRLTLSAGPESQRIPDLAGMSPRQAVLVLERMGFRVRTEVVEEATVHDGVQGTRPGAGEQVSLPGEVVLLVAEGPEVVEVPSLEGRHVDDVENLLDEAGLRLGQVRFDPTAPAAPGRVVGQSPPAGYSLRGGGFVSVVVAGAPTEAGDPDPRPGPEEPASQPSTTTMRRGD